MRLRLDWGLISSSVSGLMIDSCNMFARYELNFMTDCRLRVGNKELAEKCYINSWSCRLLYGPVKGCVGRQRHKLVRNRSPSRRQQVLRQSMLANMCDAG
eukprot:scaffold367059_cov18-Prasinocladus_malaysianus.AAC.1